MTEAYARGAALDSDNVSYPMTNALTGILLLGGPSADLKIECRFSDVEPFKTELAKARDRVNGIDVTDFWTAVADGDLRVIEALAHGTLEEKVADIGNLYLQLLESRGSSRERDSVIYQLDFLAETVRKTRQKEYGLPKSRVDRANVLAALDELLTIVRR